MRMAWALGVTLALAGCAHHRVREGGETITYTAGRCFGACPAYSVTLGPDGQGIFAGEAFTASTGEHRFQATPEQVRAFTDRLAAWRPTGDKLIEPGAGGRGGNRCREATTDQSTVDIRWQPALAPASHLRFYFGCDVTKNRAMADALLSAPDLLPIADLIGKR